MGGDTYGNPGRSFDEVEAGEGSQEAGEGDSCDERIVAHGRFPVFLPPRSVRPGRNSTARARRGSALAHSFDAGSLCAQHPCRNLAVEGREEGRRPRHRHLRRLDGHDLSRDDSAFGSEPGSSHHGSDTCPPDVDFRSIFDSGRLEEPQTFDAVRMIQARLMRPLSILPNQATEALSTEQILVRGFSYQKSLNTHLCA